MVLLGCRDRQLDEATWQGPWPWVQDKSHCQNCGLARVGRQAPDLTLRPAPVRHCSLSLAQWAGSQEKEAQVRPSLTSQRPLMPSPVSTLNHPVLFFQAVPTEVIVFTPSVSYPITSLGLSA